MPPGRRLSTALALAVVAGIASLAIEASPQNDREPLKFQSSIDLVDVDVIVTDANRHPVRDLTRDDFEIVDDGRRQEISTFSFIDLPHTMMTSRPPVDADVATNVVGRIYVVLLDGGAILQTRQTASQFVEQVVQPEDQVAVVHTLGTFSDAQTFTNSRRLMLAAIERFGRGLGAMSVLPHELIQLKACRTLEELSKRLGSITGRRKALIWIGGDIDLNTQANTVDFACRDAVKIAVRLNVAIYPVDPFGGTWFLGASELNRIAGLRAVAEETGGVAVGIGATFKRGLALIAQDTGTYYLLGYSPAPEHRDSDFHRIQVHVKRPNVIVRARTGYFGSLASPVMPSPKRAPSPVISSSAHDALRMPLPVSGLPVEASVVSFKGTGHASRLLIDARISPAALHSGARTSVTVAYQLLDIEGKIATGAYKVFTVVPHDVDVKPLRFLERVTVRPGRYELRLVAQAEDGALGSIVVPVDASPVDRALAISGIVLASSNDDEIALTEDADINTALNASPTARRRFGASERLTAFAEVYTAPDARDDVAATASVTPESSDEVVVRSRAERIAIPGAEAITAVRANLSLTGLAPGRYVLTVEAKSSRRSNRNVIRQIPFVLE
jgi:VWFA-related protein